MLAPKRALADGLSPLSTQSCSPVASGLSDFHGYLSAVNTTEAEDFSPLDSSQVEARAGIEPAHTGFADQCITTLLPRHAL